MLIGCVLFYGASAQAEPFLIGTVNSAFGLTPSEVGLRDGLKEFGYQEGRDFALGVRFTSGDPSAFPAAVQDLIGFGADLIFAAGGDALNAAQEATTTIPVVFTLADSPVKNGWVKSFARPGGNITGVADGNAILAPKRLELFKNLIPGFKRVLLIYPKGNTDAGSHRDGYRSAAKQLGVVLREAAVRSEAEAEALLRGLRKGEVNGILVPTTTGLNIPGLVLKIAPAKGIPTMFAAAFWLDLGGVASYAPDLYTSGKQAARLVEKIMRGEKPAGIPVEINEKMEFVINLKAAKAMGLKLTPEILYRADRIIR